MVCEFCASALSNSMGALLVEWVAKPFKSRLDYVRHFDYNVGKLREKKNELIAARERLQHEVEAELRQLHEIEKDVRFSQSKAEQVVTDLVSLENEIANNRRCFNWWWRYRLSKKLEKTTLPAVSQLLNEMATFDHIIRVGYQSAKAIPTIEFLSSKDFMVSKSSKAAFNQIMKRLKDDNVSMIGLWGMGGVGKTTLAHEVGAQAKKFNLFDKVVIATVSQQPDFEAIQDEIAKFLDFNMKTEEGRRRSPQELWLRLTKEKSILVILDDVWVKFNLKQKIGIPVGEDHKGCKILLTTRRRQVCDSMDCPIAVKLHCLDDVEAWNLFEMKAGLNNSSDAAIRRVATKVYKKCQGLPIALVALGSALKGKTAYEWETAWQSLRDRRLTDIEDIDENAYLCLEVSFDYLKKMGTKKSFLLCSLFPEDHEIYVEDLVRFAWGLELYEGKDSIEDVRIEVLAAMDILKNSCLLLPSGERHVKMHDLVRDVALWIASYRNQEFSLMIKSGVERWRDEYFDPCTAMSFKNISIDKLAQGLVFPNLILLLGGDYLGYFSFWNSNLKSIPSEFFEGMKALKVCALHDLKITSNAFPIPTNLRTLHLDRCNHCDISQLGQLKNLQVLSFHHSDIRELPEEIGDLNNLRLLDLSYCDNLWKIPPHLIERLSQLEELYLHGCRSIEWATDDETRSIEAASLLELNSLPNLTVLSLHVHPKYLPKDLVFCELKRFDIWIDSNEVRKDGIFVGPRTIFEECPISRSLGIEVYALHACKQLFKDIEAFRLKNLVGYGYACQNLVPSSGLKQSDFNKLTSLSLAGCNHMEELCHGHTPSGFLQNLEFVKISSCHNLRYIFPTSAAKSLGKLETLEIEDCSGLEEIIPKTEVSNICLQSLRTLSIRKCHILTSLSSLSHGQILENLTELKIYDCSQLEYTFPISMAEALPQLNKVCLFHLPRLKGRDGNDVVLSLLSLKELEVTNCPLLTPSIISDNIQVVRIHGCKDLKYVFPISVATSLGKLETLDIGDCSELKEILQKPEVSNISLQSLRKLIVWNCYKLTSLFSFPISTMPEALPQLNKVHLIDLPQLKGLDGNEVVLTLPSLQELEVANCPLLTPFFISAKIQVLHLGQMTQGKLCNMMAPELRCSRSPNMEYLRITNFEELFDCGYNLSSLKTLGLEGLRELRVVWMVPIQVVNFHNLTQLFISDCKRLSYIFSPIIARNLPQLTHLDIKRCDELEHIIEKDQTSSQDHHLQPISFPNLTKISILSCGNLRSLFPVSVALGLSELEFLDVAEVSKLEQVFEQGDEENVSCEEGKMIQLHQLFRLWLEDCPSLVSFTPVGYHFLIPSLRQLNVGNCANIKTGFRVDSEKCMHAETELQVGLSIDENIVEESAIAPQVTWPIGSDIYWLRR